MTFRSWLQVLLLAVLIAGSTWWAFREADLRGMFELLRTVSVLPLVAATFIVVMSHVVRAVRWQWLFPAGSQHVSLWARFSSVMIGYAWNTIIPRSGEVVRPFILSHRSRLDLTVSVTSVIVERVIDVVTLLVGLFAAGVLAQSVLAALLPQSSVSGLAVTLVVPILILITLVAVLAFTPIARRLPFIGRALAAIRALTGGRRWTSVGVSTLVLWLLYAIPMMFIAMSLGLPHPSSVAQAFLLLIVLSVGVTIAPTPGAVGVYHAFCATALAVMFGYSSTEGVAFAMVAWLVNYGSAVVVGGACFVWELRHGISLDDIRALRRNARP